MVGTESYTLEERQQIARTIQQQMGGGGRLHAMINAREYICGETNGIPFLRFRFSGYRKASGCQINLELNDTYSMEFMKSTKDGYVTIKKVEGVYCDTLQSTFEDETGLRLTL